MSSIVISRGKPYAVSSVGFFDLVCPYSNRRVCKFRPLIIRTITRSSAVLVCTELLKNLVATALLASSFTRLCSLSTVPVSLPFFPFKFFACATTPGSEPSEPSFGTTSYVLSTTVSLFVIVYFFNNSSCIIFLCIGDN